MHQGTIALGSICLKWQVALGAIAKPMIIKNEYLGSSCDEL
ncbi:unknow [Vibrio campbellii]|nr:unknow [Vibrio campbellii]